MHVIHLLSYRLTSTWNGFRFRFQNMADVLFHKCPSHAGNALRMGNLVAGLISLALYLELARVFLLHRSIFSARSLITLSYMDGSVIGKYQVQIHIKQRIAYGFSKSTHFTNWNLSASIDMLYTPYCYTEKNFLVQDCVIV